MRNMIKPIVMLFLATACSVHHAAMDASKLDPVFAALIAAQKGKGHSPHPAPTKGKASGDGPEQNRYDCIVYTRQAAVLRKKGIIIHSELPDFVTVWATLKQIEQMASMAEVTYIEAPKTNFPARQPLNPEWNPTPSSIYNKPQHAKKPYTPNSALRFRLCSS